jgi:hypothetical protein
MTEEENGPKGRVSRVRLPGFSADKEVGLGDVIKRATSSLGVHPCGGCERRAARLNQLVAFVPRKPFQ